MDLKLCESDLRFMTVIWENEPLASGDLVKLCAEKFDWKKSTTYTMLKKMVEKGFAQNLNSAVTSLVPREKAEKFASEHFVKHTFKGSLPGFLAAFFDGRSISEKEAEELKSLIDGYKKK